MTAVVYWFRNDLRLNDNPAFAQACQSKPNGYKIACRLRARPKATMPKPIGVSSAWAQHRKAFLAERSERFNAAIKGAGHSS